MASIISVGTNIYRLRKEARLTQDELASFLGVTKASVSKWETGQSYPDIELLPKIATYFGITVDTLIGYEPQMSRENIKRECARLREAFANDSYAEAHEKCQQLIRDYYSCYPLLTQIVLLYLNHLDLAEPAELELLADEAIELCHRIRRNSESSTDVKLAEAVEASFLLVTGNPRAAVQALGEEPDVDIGADLLLANAYSALGMVDDADKVLQGALFQSLVLGLNRLAQLGIIYVGDPAKLDTTHRYAVSLIDSFELEDVYVNAGAIHLSFAMAYVMAGNVERTLDCLEDYERAVRGIEFPIELHGNEYFDKIQAWLEDINVIGTSTPREDALNKLSLVESVTKNPAFATLADEPRFKRIVKSLEALVRQ